MMFMSMVVLISYKSAMIQKTLCICKNLTYDSYNNIYIVFYKQTKCQCISHNPNNNNNNINNPTNPNQKKDSSEEY